MPKAKNAKADEALALFRQGLRLIEIARRLDVPEGTVRRWKHSYGWGNERSEKGKANVRKKRGAPKGNKNARGHGAPKGNRNAEKYGFLSRFLPDETKEIFSATEEADPLDLLWHNIQIAYAAIIRAQRIAYVRDQQDKTVEKVGEKGGNVISERWEVQQAWDKQAAFMKAQARAQSELRSLIRQYEEMLHACPELAGDERRARIENIKANTERIQRDGGQEYSDGVVIINDAPKEAGEDIGHRHSEIPGDIQ